jgi:vitamin B12 transporter
LTTYFFLLVLGMRGVVLDPAARPVPGARIICGSETTLTDSHGEFELHTSTCSATVSKPGFATKTIALDDSKEQSIALSLASTSDRVVVTATGAPIATEEAGVSNTVFTEHDFAIRRNPNLQDYLRDVPGISVVQAGNNGALTSLFARGGDSSSTLVLLDGIPLTEPGGYMDFTHLTTAGIDRMEVIRGPESALFGAEAASAVVQIFTHQGDPESTRPHGSFTYERGSFSTDHWTAALDGGLMQKIDYAFTADQFRSTGQFQNDAYRITTGTANLGYRLSAKTVVRGIFRESDSYTGDPGQVYYGLTNLYANETARDSAVGVHVDDARTSHFDERFSFDYHRRSDLFQDPGLGDPQTIYGLVRTVNATPVPYVYFVGLGSTPLPGTTVQSYTNYPYASDSLTVTDRTDAGYQGTLTHPGGTLVFGYQFERQAGLVSAGDVARYDNGVFIQEQYALTSRIFLTGGARFEQSSTFGSKFAPRGAVTFRLPTDTFIRFSAARGITEPSLLENFARDLYFVGNPNLRPEKTNSYEAGAYREWFHRRVRTDLAVFRNSFQDLIEFSFANDPGTWINVNRSWARGAEASGTVRVNRFASVRASYTRLYTKITQSTAGDIGQALLRQPRNSGSVSMELTPRMFSLIAGARFVGERQDNDFVFGVNRSPGYQYVFVSGSWQATRHIEPFVRIENAADQVYQEALGYSSLARTAFGGVKLKW